MKTIRSYGNNAEANFARSLLESAGIQAVLADELVYTMEPPMVPWGIRLQVPEDEVARALEILDERSTFLPLEEEFEPPASEQDEVITPVHDSELGRWAFVEGGCWGLGLYGLLKLAAVWMNDALPADASPWLLATRAMFNALTALEVRDLFIPFCIGGVLDIAVRAFVQRARRLRELELDERG
jgi:hypothetical protein